jgi:hypothetical protein
MHMSELQLLLWMAGIHVIGLVVIGVLMIPSLRDQPDEPGPETDSGSDDGWGNLPSVKPDPRGWPGGGLPLPDAEQSRIRLREPARLAEKLAERERRPAHTPERVPHRVPAQR